MQKTKTTLIALLSAAVLTACGGGGGDGTTTDPRTKYVGTWHAQCSTASWLPGDIPRYEKEQIVIRSEGDSNLAVTSTEILFLDSSCVQPATGETGDTNQATLTFIGSTKTLADGKVVDKVRAALAHLDPGVTTVAAILYTAENKIYVQINDPDEPVAVDGEGFPNALNLDDYQTKADN